MTYYLHKIIAHIIGFNISILPTPIVKFLLGGSDHTLIGVDAANLPNANTYSFRPEIIRITDNNNVIESVKWCEEHKIEYFVQTGQGKDATYDARTILDFSFLLKGKKQPLFYSVTNEQNDYTYSQLADVKKITSANGVNNVTKGSYTSITESAGIKKYFSIFSKKIHIDTTLPHVIHFYLRPQKDNLITNMSRIALLYYMIFRLKLLGVPAKNIYIGETHDASDNTIIEIDLSEKRPYTFVDRPDGDLILEKLDNGKLKVRRYEGDLVFGSKEGWELLEKVAKRIGVAGILYYHDSFLGYRGNTVLEARKNIQ